MNEHTPQIPDPVRPLDLQPSGVDATPSDPAVIDPSLVDLITGDPPVPITVWRTARTNTDTGRSISARLAYRLIAAYSRPGEAVVDLTDEHTLAAACTAGQRRHHRGWFTDTASLIIGPATPPAETSNPTRSAGADDGELPELGAWFGDDLTDPDLPPTGEPATALPNDASVQAASLVVASWPLDTADAANRVKLAWLLTACAQLLRPGGCLVLVVAVPAGTLATPEDFSPVAAAAARVGLSYLQHIVAVAAEADGDVFIYHVSDEELLALAADDRPRWAVAHLRVHADLLVFSQAAPPDQPRRSRTGGGRRG